MVAIVRAYGTTRAQAAMELRRAADEIEASREAGGGSRDRSWEWVEA